MTLTEDCFRQVPADTSPETAPSLFIEGGETGVTPAVQMRLDGLAEADSLRQERDEALQQVDAITLRSNAVSQENARLADLLSRTRRELSQQMLDHISIVTRWEGLYRNLLAERDEAMRDARTWRSTEPARPGNAGPIQDLEL